MGQVPKYAIIGNGRMAVHLCHYFTLLDISYVQWYRTEYERSTLDSFLPKITHIIVLISDDSIDGFIEEFGLLQHKHLTTVHFSGSLVSPKSFAAHPLQTFSEKSSYSLDEYQKFPFIIDEAAPPFGELLPGLINPHYRVAEKDKAYYHTMCVLANNVTTLLWQKFNSEMCDRFSISSEDLQPFLQKTFENIRRDSATALTGPIARKDHKTLARNLDSLSGDPFYTIFEEIINQFAPGGCDEKCS
jgi:hypothetical protein